MVSSIVSFLSFLNTLSPLAVIALLSVIIYMLVKSKSEVTQKVETIGSNHLHELPELTDTIRDMHRTLVALDAFLRAKLNGGK